MKYRVEISLENDLKIVQACIHELGLFPKKSINWEQLTDWLETYNVELDNIDTTPHVAYQDSMPDRFKIFLMSDSEEAITAFMLKYL